MAASYSAFHVRGQTIEQQVKANKNFTTYVKTLHQLTNVRNDGSGVQPIIVYKKQTQPDGTVKTVATTINRRQLSNASGQSYSLLVNRALASLSGLHRTYVKTGKITHSRLNAIITKEFEKARKKELENLSSQYEQLVKDAN